MGLDDRHYIRDREPVRGAYGRGGWQSMRMWSVTSWIILICVAVFVLDNLGVQKTGWSLLPMRDVPTGVFDNEYLYQLDPGTIFFGSQYVREAVRLPNGQVASGLWRSVHERSSSRQIGWALVHHLHFLECYLLFSTRLGFLVFEWWRFVGFQFLHANFSHVLFNMLGLYFFGIMVERYLGPKRYLAFYLLCGICGALMYLALNLTGYAITMIFQQPVRFPGLLFDDPSTPLVGASAGIFGVLMAGAYIAPREIVYIFGLIPIRLNILAYALVAIALFTVLTGGENAGGQAGHLGGAIAGYYFVRRPYHLHGFLDLLGRVDPTSHHYRQRQERQRIATRRAGRDDEVDRILDKINVEGVHSLTESEKRTLHEASQRDA